MFSRIAQEYSSKIHNVDMVNTTDAAHVYAWKNDGLLAPYVPADVAAHFDAAYRDKDGLLQSCASCSSPSPTTPIS